MQKMIEEKEHIKDYEAMELRKHVKKIIINVLRNSDKCINKYALQGEINQIVTMGFQDAEIEM